MQRRIRPAIAGLFVTTAALAALQEPHAAPAARVHTVRVPDGGIQPQALVDGRGVLHLLYFSGEPRAGDLFYVRSTDFGATFSTPVKVNSQSGSAIATGTIRGGHFAIGRGGRVHVAWNGSDTAAPRASGAGLEKYQTAPFLYTRSNAEGTAFEAQRNLVQRTHSIDGGGAIAADAAGRVYAVWHAGLVGGSADEEQRRVWISRSDNDGATFTTEQPVSNASTGVCGCCGLQAIAHPKYGLWLLYRSATQKTHRDVYVLGSTDGGRTFAESRVHRWDLNACPMTSMALAGEDRLLGAWETAGQVYFGALDTSSARIPSPITAPNETGGRKHPRVAVAPNGDTLLLWTEGMGWAKGGSLAWQAFDAKDKPLADRGAAPGVPVWSFGAVVAKPNGEFVILY